MNPKDMALLTYGDIDGEYLVFYRAKTVNSSWVDSKPIRTFITDEMWQIIGRWGTTNKHTKNYIFPILSEDMNPIEQHLAVKALVEMILNQMENIRKALKIDKKIGSMQARHRCATALKLCGATTEYIQETLGHADVKTTENYLGIFEDDVKKEFAEKLSAFKVNKKKGLVKS